MPRNQSNYVPREGHALSQLFEQQAAKTPHAVAVVYGPQRLQYKELNRRANQVARYLRERGTSRGCLVGVGIERSLEMIVAILGILKSGAAYVPLDPSYPRDRLAWMLADCEAPVLLTASSLTDRFGGYRGQIVCLDREWAAIHREATANLAERAQAGDRAYVMYTSGSAGWPKGVQIAHRSVANAAHAMRAKIGMSASDVVLFGQQSLLRHSRAGCLDAPHVRRICGGGARAGVPRWRRTGG